MSQYYTLLTDIGAAKLANATALGQSVQLVKMAVGDGNGSLPIPKSSQTGLVNERRKENLNSVSIDENNANYIICEQVIPENEGGYYIREVGVFDLAGDLIAVGNFPETYKPLLVEGSGRTQTIRCIIMVNSSNTATVELKIDPSVVLATRDYVDESAKKSKTEADNAYLSSIGGGEVGGNIVVKKNNDSIRGKTTRNNEIELIKVDESDVVQVGSASSTTAIRSSRDVLLGGSGSVQIPNGVKSERSLTPNKGMFRFNSDELIFEGYDGFKWSAVGLNFNQYAKFTDTKASGLSGGESKAGVIKRTLNTVDINTITGLILDDSKIFFPLGIYYIIASAPAFDSEAHQAWIRNSSTQEVVGDLVGVTAFSSLYAATRSEVRGLVTVESEITMELAHYFQGATHVNGMGVAVDSAINHKFASFEVWKLG